MTVEVFSYMKNEPLGCFCCTQGHEKSTSDYLPLENQNALCYPSLEMLITNYIFAR